MFDYLVEHARSHVWCAPEQDYQHIYKPARISGPRGAHDKAAVEWQTVKLPNRTDRFHVYQVGQIHPVLLGLISRHHRWYSAAETCMLENVVLNLYTVNGVSFPLGDCYIQLMGDRNIILAVKVQTSRFPDLEKEALYFRMYSNAYLQSDRSKPGFQPFQVSTYTHTNSQAFLTWQRKLQDVEQLPGQVVVHRNGFRIDRPRSVGLTVGDVFEYVYDSTVYQTVDWPVADLNTFDSELDQLRKYLLHHPRDSHETIEYLDDVDFWLLKKASDGSEQGVFFHRNQRNTVRMLSHQDYAVPVPYVVGFATATAGWGNIKDLTLRVHIRHSGWDRPLVDEHHRIKELYKLPEGFLERAMVGVDSTVSVWRAPSLESSQYPAIMRAEGVEITPLQVQQAYGYNAVAKLMADTPQRTPLIQGRPGVQLPPGLHKDATVYEYDENGRLLGFYNHNQQTHYWARNQACVLIEALVGIGGTLLTTIYDRPTQVLDPNHNYRFYKTPVHLGKPMPDQWEDVTGSNDYTVINNRVQWNIPQEYWYTAVKNDLNFLAYSIRLTPTNGVLRFSLTARELRQGVAYNQVLQIPVGQLDLWLNGHPLIRGLDYYLIGAQVVIVTKEYWVAGEQLITVRGTGFCESDLSMAPPAEYGWVDHGELSRNGRFDIRDDKIIRIVVRGAVKHRDTLQFVEDNPKAQITGVRNGDPYVIENVIVPIQGLTGTDTYGYRAESVKIDQEVSDYLSLFLPEPELDTPNVIPERYQVYSPFCCKVLRDLQDDILKPDGIDGHWNEQDLQRWLKPYEWLLAYDPCVVGVDSRYVSIHPHETFLVTEVDIYQYALLERAVKFYLNDRVDLTRFVSIKQGWL